MTITLHQNDLPADVTFTNSVAIDTETMGLNHYRDRLCVVQLSAGDGDAHLVQMTDPTYNCPNLKAVLTDPTVTKLFHFGRFDIAILYHALGILCQPVYCTKIASKLIRTYSDKHGLKELCKELLGIDLSKQQQTSDWGTPKLSQEQIQYAANDVLHLHALKAKLDERLKREGRESIAQACYHFLPHRAILDLSGWEGEKDVFGY